MVIFHSYVSLPEGMHQHLQVPVCFCSNAVLKSTLSPVFADEITKMYSSMIFPMISH